MDLLVIIDELEKIFINWGYPLIFISSLIETTPVGWAIPGGTIVVLGGFFASGGSLSLVGVILSGWMGMYTTFLIAYYAGLKTGLLFVRKFKQEKNAAVAKHLLTKHGAVILTTSLLANLTRFWVAYLAGVQKYNVLKYIFYSGAASLTWTSLLVSVGYLAGTEREKLELGVARIGILSWVILFFVAGFVYWKTKKEYKEFKTGNEDS